MEVTNNVLLCHGYRGDTVAIAAWHLFSSIDSRDRVESHGDNDASTAIV